MPGRERYDHRTAQSDLTPQSNFASQSNFAT